MRAQIPFKLRGVGDAYYAADPTVTDDSGVTYDTYTGEIISSDTVAPDPVASDPNQSAAETARLAAIDQTAASMASNPPAQVTTTSADSSISFEQVIKGIGAIASAVTQYSKTQLPNGGAVYTRINPATGQPYTYGGAVTLSSSSFLPSSLTTALKSTPVMLGVGLLALYFLTGKK